MSDFCSDAYSDVLLATHKSTGMRWGGAGKSHADTVTAFANELQAWTILDYGCGRGTLKDSIQWPVEEYDPGIPGKRALPKPADLVVCTDVLEHVEGDKIDNVLRHLRSLTRKGIFLVIALTPARQILVDGRNAHISLHPAAWWIKRLTMAGFKIDHTTRRKGLWIWAKPGSRWVGRLKALVQK